MRILALVTDAFGGTGGISQFNRDLISACAELAEVERIVVLPRFAQHSTPPPNAKIAQRVPIARAAAYACRAIAQSVVEPRFDVVFCGHLHMMPLALLVSRLSAAPVWLQIHGLEAWAARARWMRWCVEQADLVTSVSRHTRRLFLGWADVEPTRVLILPNTVGEHFTPGVDRESAKKTLGLAGRRVLLTVSRLAKTERYKGHEAIIRRLPEIAEKFADVVYVIAGEGDLRKELKKLVQSLKLDHFVVFTGAMRSSELATLYAGADVYVMPSSGEGFGIVYLEAMACGTPVIAGDCDGAHDPLHDGDSGVLTNEDRLSKDILRLLKQSCDSPEKERSERGEKVRRYFGRTVFNDRVKLVIGSVPTS